jgi:hypothetical protein
MRHVALKVAAAAALSLTASQFASAAPALNGTALTAAANSLAGVEQTHYRGYSYRHYWPSRSYRPSYSYNYAPFRYNWSKYPSTWYAYRPSYRW